MVDIRCVQTPGRGWPRWLPGESPQASAYSVPRPSLFQLTLRSRGADSQLRKGVRAGGAAALVGPDASASCRSMSIARVSGRTPANIGPETSSMGESSSRLMICGLWIPGSEVCRTALFPENRGTLIPTGDATRKWTPCATGGSLQTSGSLGARASTGPFRRGHSPVRLDGGVKWRIQDRRRIQGSVPDKSPWRGNAHCRL